MKRKIKTSSLVIKDYKKLISEISEINGMVFHSQSIINEYIRMQNKIDPKKFGNFRLGSHFYYESPYDGSHIWGDFYKLKTSNISQKTAVINRKLTNYYVALAYENFEKFLRSITARIIINNKKAAQETNEILGFSSYRSCMLFLQNQYRDNSKIISLLRSLSVELDTSFRKEKGLKNFLNFYRVYSKCRNHIIHSNDFVGLNSFEKPEKIDEKFAERYFGLRKSNLPNKRLIDTTNTYKEVLETIASFAYLLITSFDSTFINKS